MGSNLEIYYKEILGSKIKCISNNMYLSNMNNIDYEVEDVQTNAFLHGYRLIEDEEKKYVHVCGYINIDLIYNYNEGGRRGKYNFIIPYNDFIEINENSSEIVNINVNIIDDSYKHMSNTHIVGYFVIKIKYSIKTVIENNKKANREEYEEFQDNFDDGFIPYTKRKYITDEESKINIRNDYYNEMFKYDK